MGDATAANFDVCSLCWSTVNFLPTVARLTTDEGTKCALCFSMLQDVALHDRIVQTTINELRRNAYDTNTFLLALNTPITMHFREIVLEKLLGDAWVPMMMSPKSQLSLLLMTKIAEVTGLRPTLNSNLILTVTLSHDEFVKSDIEYLVTHHASALLNRGKRRRGGRKKPEDVSAYYTKVKINDVANVMTKESVRDYEMTSPTQPFELAVSFERESIFIAGRYQKFSRTLPQSPWTSEPYTPKIPLNSVSEQIGETLKKHFNADNYRFVSCGREDIDVRMLGNGRPFAVEVLNARKVQSITHRSAVAETMRALTTEINQDHPDIRVSELWQATAKEVLSLNVGAEDKRKIYSALCYSKTPLTSGNIGLLNAAAPLDVMQRTVIRVLKRRPLIDRRRTIFAMSALQLDDYHFIVKFETQAGTYVKELVHGDFGRTRPSLGGLMGLPLDQVDILELDVEGVDFVWPPAERKSYGRSAFKR